MIVINTCINQSSGMSTAVTEKFIEKTKTIGVNKYISVYTVPQFLEALETYKNQRILLFTNFSPNYFYEKNGIDFNECQEKPMPDWPVKEYGFSAGLYYRICREYSFVAIHFITAANKLLVPDTLFFKITGNTPTTVKRKQDWTKPGMNYVVFLKHYLLQKIRDATNCKNN